MQVCSTALQLTSYPVDGPLELKPGRHLTIAALFDAYQLRLKTVLDKNIPYQLLLMVPYVLSIVTLVIMARRAERPHALMQPYIRGER